MKRTTTLIFLILSTIIPCYAQSIEVTKPGSGDTWYIGKTHEITWSKSGIVNDDLVKIRLYNSTGTVKIWDITNKTDNDGSFHWTIPTSIDPGSYRVRVKTLLKATTDDTGTFKIEKAAPNYIKPIVPKPVEMATMDPIRIISPVKGETWRLGESRTIKWTPRKTSSNNAPAKLSIYIISKEFGRSGPIWITWKKYNTGQYIWDIPSSPKIKRFHPGKYHMVFRGPSGKDLAKREFNILNPTTLSLLPSGTKGFQILDKLEWFFAGKGKLGVLTITVKANSINDFALLGTMDGKDFGTQWLECWVSCKIPTGHSNSPPKSKTMVRNKYSVSGNNGTKKFFKVPAYPTIIKKNGTYKLSFVFKDHSDVLCYVASYFKKTSGLPTIQLRPGTCYHYYYPKLTVFLYTRMKSGGILKTRKIFYLDYKVNFKFFPQRPTDPPLNYTTTFFEEKRSYCGIKVKW